MPYIIEAEIDDDVLVGQLVYIDHKTGKLTPCKRERQEVCVAMENYKKGELIENNVHNGRNRRA